MDNQTKTEEARSRARNSTCEGNDQMSPDIDGSQKKSGLSTLLLFLMDFITRAVNVDKGASFHIWWSVEVVSGLWD